MLAAAAAGGTFKFGGVPFSPGSNVQANVPLSALEKSYAGQGGNPAFSRRPVAGRQVEQDILQRIVAQPRRYLLRRVLVATGLGDLLADLPQPLHHRHAGLAHFLSRCH